MFFLGEAVTSNSYLQVLNSSNNNKISTNYNSNSSQNIQNSSGILTVSPLTMAISLSIAPILSSLSRYALASSSRRLLQSESFSPLELRSSSRVLRSKVLIREEKK